MSNEGIIPTAFKKLKDSYITTVYDCGDLDRLQQEIVAEIRRELQVKSLYKAEGGAFYGLGLTDALFLLLGTETGA